MIGLGVGLLLYCTGWRFPEVITSTINFVADLNTPLAMIITGVFLASVNLGETLRDMRVHFASLLRVVLFPLLMLALIKLTGAANLFPKAEVVAFSILIACACPSAASTVLMISKMGGDSTHGAKVLAVSTVLSLVTLPLMVILYNLVPSL